MFELEEQGWVVVVLAEANSVVARTNYFIFNLSNSRLFIHNLNIISSSPRLLFTTGIECLYGSGSEDAGHSSYQNCGRGRSCSVHLTSVTLRAFHIASMLPLAATRQILKRNVAAGLRCFKTAGIATDASRRRPASTAVCDADSDHNLSSTQKSSDIQRGPISESGLFSPNRVSKFSARNRIIGTLPPEVAQLQVDIVSGKIEVKQHFASCIEKQSLTSEIIGAGLRAEFERLQRFNRMQRATAIKRDNKQLARLILEHMIGSTSRLEQLNRLLLESAEAKFYICYFAVAEGYDAVFEKLIFTDLSLLPLSITDLEMIRMRNALLVDLVRAHLTFEWQHRADDAIKCLFRIQEKKDSIQSQGREYIGRLSFAGAIGYLSAGLLEGSFWKTDEGLWERFDSFCKSYVQGGRESAEVGRYASENILIRNQFNSAGRQLRHPIRPRYEPFVAFLRTWLPNDSPSS